MKKYILIHSHRFGVATFPFQINRNLEVDPPNEKEWVSMIGQLRVDFEPERDDESLEWAPIGKFKTIQL